MTKNVFVLRRYCALFSSLLYSAANAIEKTWPPRSWGMGSLSPFGFPPFRIFDFTKTIIVKITLYRRTPHAFVQTIKTHTHTFIYIRQVRAAGQ